MARYKMQAYVKWYQFMWLC